MKSSDSILPSTEEENTSKNDNASRCPTKDFRGLGDEEFKEFKWYLWQKGMLEDFPSIPKSKVQKLDRKDTVDEMCNTYRSNTIKVTVMVLKKMSRNDLVEDIQKTMKEPADANMDTEQRVELQKWLKSVRTQLVQRLSAISQILDKLYEEEVITEEEMGDIKAQTGKDKAREMIDRVLRKGPRAVSVLKTALSEFDKDLFNDLN